MNPAELRSYLDSLIQHGIRRSLMIWGPPGIGKSSIVAQAAQAHGLEMIDVRLSQLAPTDLRGLPVAEEGVARWYIPEFLPRTGAGVLFLDELNLAPPVVQGIAQQLILDRRIGSYAMPEGWLIWAAGNRKEDRAAVFDMPAPLANRFLHVEVQPDVDSFKAYALARGLHEQIIAFLAFRPELLHKLDPQQPAWPSPRSWEMASELHGAGIPVASAVGIAAASEFLAYAGLYRQLPDLERILRGHGDKIAFPNEPSVRYATVIGLTARAGESERALNAFRWLISVATPEWVQLYAADLFRLLRERGQLGALAALLAQEPALQQFLDDYRAILQL